MSGEPVESGPGFTSTAVEINPADSGDGQSVDDPGEPEPMRALRREAAGYRTKLRAAESARDALATRVEGLQRGEVERLVSDRLTAPSDLWLTGVQLPELLDESGGLDPGKVAAAVDRVLESRPHWRKQQFTVVPVGQGARRPVPVASGPDLASVLRQHVQ